MTIAQLNSLKEEEMEMLWGSINLISPVMNYDLSYKIFTSIDNDSILQRIEKLKDLINSEYNHIYDSLREKMGMSKIERKEESQIKQEFPISSSIQQIEQ